MSHYSKIFEKIPVDIPNRSGFDMSHENVFTAKCGTLTPCLVDELLPNDTVSLGVASQVQLPPMATDFYGRVQCKFETFFVPFRILYGGWQELIAHPGDTYPTGAATEQKAKYLPYFILPGAQSGPGSLADYLGIKNDSSTSSAASSGFWVQNPLPFVAYHKIYDDWYRESRIQVSPFSRYQAKTFRSIPYWTDYSDSPYNLSSTLTLADSVSLYSLRQRNWPKDYFTNATAKPQAGDEAALAFTVTTDSTIDDDGNMTGSGSFTIASLRAANAVQQFLERNNKSGYRYGDVINFNFGIYPSDATTDRCLYLGSWTMDVYNKSVYQTASGSTGVNPTVGVVGSKGASSQAAGDGSLVQKFTATEHGYLMTIFSLVPSALYATGSRRYLTRSSYSDFPWPALAGVGDQEIYLSEIAADSTNTQLGEVSGTFGYTQRYAENKYMDDEVHGLLRDGSSLEAFALQRSFTSNSVSLGSSFLQIPTTYLDQVTAVSSAVSTYGCWVDCYFKYKKVSTLPAYSIPTLGDPRDTHVEIKDNGGKRL